MVTRLASHRWLSYWSAQDDAEEKARFYLAIYAALIGGATVFVFIRALLVALAGLNASKNLHDSLIQRVPSFSSS